MSTMDSDETTGATGKNTELEWTFKDDGGPVWENEAGTNSASIPKVPTQDPAQRSPRRATQTSLTAVFTGNGSAARVAAVRSALDRALDAWWSQGVLPSNALLRDGLLVLEAGNELDESQCSLLLRTALNRQKGMLTALRYQTDPDLSGLLLAEALLDTDRPLPFDELDRLRRQDDASEQWLPPLRLSLQEVLTENDRARRAQALAILTALDRPAGLSDAASTSAIDAEIEQIAAGGWLRWRWTPLLLLLIAVVLVVVAMVWRQRITRWPEMAMIPAGFYPVSTGDDAEAPIELAAFAIDWTEVTNQDYRRCYENGACTWPAANKSETRDAYFLNPAFDRYPVVNVNWEQAREYCASIGKRLPTASEWEVAAGYAPATERRYRYPWGDQFIVQAANSRALGNDDTQMVGAYQPAGDSPFGVTDMAGNVAEWTATEVATADQPGAIVVKGGSFQDDAEAIQVASRQLLPPSTTAVWLGFRCAASRLAE